jgi:hypothetical protein
MRREDWWWLAIRVFALWLVVDGVRMLPWLLATVMGVSSAGSMWLQGMSWESTSSMLPLLAFGLLLLFSDQPFRLAARGRRTG